MNAILSEDVLNLVNRVDIEQLDLARLTLLAASFDVEAGVVSDALLTLALLKGLAEGDGKALKLLARPIRAELGRAAQAVPALRMIAGEGGDHG